MATKKTFALASAVAMAIGGMASAAPTPYIGVNFVGGSFGGAPTSLDPTDSAGVVPQTNYNNVTGQTGAALALNNASGVATAVTLTFAGAGTWGTGVGTATPNAKLMNGYVDGSDAVGATSNTYTFNNVPAGKYNVIVYTLPDGLDGRDQSVALNGDVASTVFVSSDAGANLSNGFVRATGTSKDGAGATGNYVEFDNVSPVAGTFSIVGTSLAFRNFSNGIQLVTADVPEPAAISVLGLGAAALLGRRRRKQA